MNGLPINPARLQWCLRHYCLTLEDLAKRAGVSAAAVRRASEGGPGLTSEQAWALTEVFEFELGFFMDKKAVSKDELREPQFRTAAGQPRRTTELMLLLARVERHRGYFIGLYEESPGWKERKVSCPKLPAGDDYAAKAKAVRCWLKLRDGTGFAEMREKVEDKGILVFVGSGGNGRWQVPQDSKGRDQFKGFMLRYDALPIIFVAKEQDERHQSFTLMHELAHLIMHEKDAIDGERSLATFNGASRSRREIEANMLASHVLLPESAVRAIDVKALANLPSSAIDEVLRKTCDRYRVSAMVALARLRADRLVPAKVVDGYLEWSSKVRRPQKSGKPTLEEQVVEVWEIFGYRYVDRVFALEDEQDITTYDALVYLDIIDEVYDVMRGREWY